MPVLKNIMEHDSDNDTNHNWNPWNNPEKSANEMEELEIWEGIETVHTIALMKSARILGRVLAAWGQFSLGI